jgi:calmodulin
MLAVHGERTVVGQLQVESVCRELFIAIYVENRHIFFINLERKKAPFPLLIAFILWVVDGAGHVTGFESSTSRGLGTTTACQHFSTVPPDFGLFRPFNSLMEHLSEEEIAEFREIFNLVDRDGGGSITAVELGELMDTLGIDASPEDIEHMIKEIDQDGNGDIDFEEFVAVMSRKVNATYTSDQVKRAFKVFEHNTPPGYVRAETLIKSLTTYCTEKMNIEQAHDLVGQLEIDNNGLINYAEYVNMMMSS